MTKKQALFLLFASTACMAPAQRQCLSQAITERWMQAHAMPADIAHEAPLPEGQPGPRDGVRTIPVVFHVVWNTAAENVPNGVIQGIIAQMNADYRALNTDYNNVRSPFTASRGNAQIEFCLATVDPNGNPTTGIVRKETSKTWFNPDSETDDMKFGPLGSPAWNATKYLNIWICDISSGASGGFVTEGYAYIPVGGLVGSPIDGVVLDYNYGTTGRAATHETGHYLGLSHPWGNGDGNCDPGDGIGDTPATDSPSFSCGNPGLMKCGTLTQYENFMDYSSCRVMFTNGQVNVMGNILGGARASLLTSGACGSPPVEACIPTSEVGPADGDFIDGVVLEGINNPGTGSPEGATYQNYTFLSASLARGSSYTLHVTTGEYFQDMVAAWLDFNADNQFTADEMIGDTISEVDFQDIAFPFTVPLDAALGNTLLRVRLMSPGEDDIEHADPCFSYLWGETEDYRVVIGGLAGFLEVARNELNIRQRPDEVVITWANKAARQQALLIDAVGRTLHTSEVPGTELVIKTADLAPGMYQVVLLQDGAPLTMRFVAGMP